MQRFRGGLVFKAHRLFYHSTLGLRVIKKEEAEERTSATAAAGSTLSDKIHLHVDERLICSGGPALKPIITRVIISFRAVIITITRDCSKYHNDLVRQSNEGVACEGGPLRAVHL